jgi:hypothetical protein
MTGWVEVDAAPYANTAPQASEPGATERVGPDRHPIEPPLVPALAEADQAGRVGEQRQLNGLGQPRGVFRRVPRIL